MPHDDPFATPGGVDLAISPRDGMCDDETSYLRGGASALRAILVALATSPRPAPRRILDLPCGHGRVMRYLRAAYPDAELVACDIERDAVDYCAERFGAVPVYSAEEPASVALPGAFDLIWVGSLLTHLPAPRWQDWFTTWESVIATDGVLVFSVHGRFVWHRIHSGETYGLHADAAAEVLRQNDATGFGYADFSGRPGYGISLCSADWVIRRILERQRWKLLSYSEMALNGHQDVVACQRVATT